MNRKNLTIAQMLESGGPGGAETVLLQLSDELASRGHRIVPVRYRDGESWLDSQLRDRGWSPHYLPLRRAVDPSAVGALRRILEVEQVDVAHSHEFTMAVYGAAATRGAGIRHVVTMHGNQTVTNAWRRRTALRWAFRRSHKVVAVSQATHRDMLERLGSSVSPFLTVIPNGVPARPGSPEGPTAEFGLRPEEIVILAVGNLSKRKGHIILLEAMAALEGQGLEVPWRVLIAGRGDEEAALRGYIESAGLQGRAHLLGHRDDIPDLQAAAHILCMPSLWEGLPLAVLEGMHAGNCVVATRTSGIPEAIEDGSNGLLVPPGEVAPLASALRRVLEDTALRTRLADAALATARARFSISGMADQYEALYR